MPEKKTRYITHTIADPPICDECQKHELSFFDPGCPGCSDILTDSETCISELFAIIRQWVPQVQQNLGTFVNEIIKRGAGVNDRDGLTDMTLLHYACKSGAVGVGDLDSATALVNDLITQGADVSLRCRWTDMLPIHYAAFFNSGSIIRVLLKASSSKDIDAVCSGFDNGTVLHIATSNLCLDAAKCLLQHGANAFIKDSKNRTPLACIPEVSNFERDSPSAVIVNKLRRLLSEAETSGSESGVESGTDCVINALDILGLKIGDKVTIGESKVGTLRYCGCTDFAKGQWAGVELDEAVGKNNGSVGGRSYFECKPKYGIFCPLSKISKLETKSSVRQRQRPNSAKLQSSQSRQSSQEKAGSLPGSRSSSRASSPQPRTKVEQETTENIEIGTRVVVIGEENRRGVARFVGETQFAQGVWIGVELDKCSGKNDGSINGVRYFECQPKHGVFLHPSKLKREDASSLRDSKIRSSSEEALNHNRLSDHRGSNSRLSDHGGSVPRLSDHGGSVPRLSDHGGSNSTLSDHGGSNSTLSDHGGSNRRLSDHGGSNRRLSDQEGLKSSLGDHGGSNPDLSEGKSFLKPLSRRLSSSVPDLSTKTESHHSGIPRLKRHLVKKDAKETKQILKEGTHIYVNNEVGVLRFIGKTTFGKGIWLGVELSKPVGKNDGSVNGEKYFTCKPNHGLFVRPNRATHHGINCSKLLSG